MEMRNEPNRFRTLSSYVAAFLLHVLIFLLLSVSGFLGSGSGSGDDPPNSGDTASLESQPLDLIFVEVAQSLPEPPPDDTPFYSNQDSVAESETIEEDADNLAPIDGNQENSIRLEDTNLIDSLRSQQMPENASQSEQNSENQPEPENASQVSAPPPQITVQAPELPEVTGSPVQPSEDSPQESDAPLPPIPNQGSMQKEDIQSKWSQLFGSSDDQGEESETIQESQENQWQSSESAITRPPQPISERRPRSLAEARRKNQLVGEKSLVKSTARRLGTTGMVDAQSKSFGDYDLRMQVAIQNTWYGIVSNLVLGEVDRGRVVIKFRLLENGSIEPTQVTESSVGLLLSASCQEAIERAAPFGPWPKKMRDEIGMAWRDITFTFNYL